MFMNAKVIWKWPFIGQIIYVFYWQRSYCNQKNKEFNRNISEVGHDVNHHLMEPVIYKAINVYYLIKKIQNCKLLNGKAGMQICYTMLKALVLLCRHVWYTNL